jgi:hypothetical protein
MFGEANLLLKTARIKTDIKLIMETIDHGRSDELGYGVNNKTSTFPCSVFVSGLAFLGQIGKASLSQFTKIQYVLSI